MSEVTLSREVAEQLRSLVIAVLKLEISPHEILDESNLHELGLESMSVVELLTQIEIAFDITIDVEDLSSELFTRFDTLADFVQRKIDESR